MVKTSHVIILVLKEICIRGDIKQAFTWEERLFFFLIKKLIDESAVGPSSGHTTSKIYLCIC
jgi:hypothetical protein